MTYLLDTNVVSEWTRPRPNPGVTAWLNDIDEDRLFLSVVTLAELRHGVERLAAGGRKRRFDGWLSSDLPARFVGRILPIDATVAVAWGRIVARCQTAGRPMSAMDGLIAATAVVHDLQLVTRNVADFEGSLTVVLSPWTES